MSTRTSELAFAGEQERPERPPDFFLSSGEGLFWSEPRACWLVRALEGPVAGRDYALVYLSPPAIGQAFGRGGDDVYEIIVTPRSTEDRLPLGRRNRLPVDVHLLVPLEARAPEESFSLDQVEHDAWGTLVRTHEEALAMHESALRRDRFTA